LLKLNFTAEASCEMKTGIAWPGGGRRGVDTSDEQGELNHPSTHEGRASSDRSSCSLGRGAATGLIRGPGLAARWSGDAPLLSDAVCAPLRILRPGISLSLVVYERWCLFLLACPRRRRATDFTHFYWLIWLFSCQQPRASQEPENPRDGGATATVAALWLWMPAGRIGGGGGGPLLSHNK